MRYTFQKGDVIRFVKGKDDKDQYARFIGRNHVDDTKIYFETQDGTILAYPTPAGRTLDDSIDNGSVTVHRRIYDPWKD